ncbi:DUF4403 family protein [Sinorhizobium fredii]|uniref:DUF4403 family protein n=1 Tax=Rhizobium fredii TaxID=380 RepID=UPI0004B52953|nr:DUF4403 family protein [Sinorhizobium fredii]
MSLLMRCAKNRAVQVLSLTASAAIGLVACNPWSTSYDVPPKTEDAVHAKSKTSAIVIPISAKLVDLQERLNSEVPSVLYAVNENRDACVPAKWAKYCLIPRPFGGCIQEAKTQITPAIDCHLKGSVTRGKITLGGSGDMLSMNMPVKVEVTAKGRGEIGKNIQETADGTATVAVTLKFDLDEDWQPSAAVTAKHTWDKTIGIDILGFRITFADKVDPKIEEALQSLQGKIPEMLAKLNLKEQAANAWSKGFDTFRVNEKPDVWVRFSPEAIGYSGYSIVPDGDILVSVMAKGKTETFVGEKPQGGPTQPLPKLVRQLPNPGFEFYLPISVDYSILEDSVGKTLKLGQVQTFDVPDVGKIEATFQKVQVYQTKDNAIAIGLTAVADPPTGFLDTSGTIWLTGKFDVDNEAKKLSVNKLDVYGETDNNTVDLLISLARFGPINEELRKGVSYNFSREYEKGMVEANKFLRRQVSDDFYFDGKLDNVTADGLSGGPTGVILGFSALGSGELRFGKLPK